MISQEMVCSILACYALPWEGTHGIPHWARVLENGRRLSAITGAKVQIVELFALFHDSQRINEGFDDGHGRRGAKLARELSGVEYDISNEDFKLLIEACELHTDGLLGGDVTLQTCWDADRLDLGRVGITPLAEKLCTEGAKRPDLFKWAARRGEEQFIPNLISSEWGIRLP